MPQQVPKPGPCCLASLTHGFKVQVLRFWVQGLGFLVQGSGFRVQVFWLRVHG